MLPFSALQWLIIWCLRFLPYPITQAAIRSATMLTFLGAWFGVWIVQLRLYQKLSGVHVLKNDRVFVAVTLFEIIISLLILLSVALEWRQKEKRLKNQ